MEETGVWRRGGRREGKRGRERMRSRSRRRGRRKGKGEGKEREAGYKGLERSQKYTVSPKCKAESIT